MRRFFEQRGSLEVETPTRVHAPGTDLNLDPFPVEENFLITSPEFHMKRLVAAGFSRIHQICHCFRRDEAGSLHNPEFTMLEWYWAGVDYFELAKELEHLVATAALKLNGTTKLPGREVDVNLGWEYLSVAGAFERYAGWKPDAAPDTDRFFYDLVDKVEPELGRDRPTILYEYPASQAVLSRPSPTNPEVALRFEAYVDGIELVNAFDELTDPDEQRRRFLAENEARVEAGKPALPIDEKLLAALTQMPPTAGAALGLDRLVLLLTGAKSLDEVVAFPEPWL